MGGTPSLEFTHPHVVGTISLYTELIFLAKKIFQKSAFKCLLLAQSRHSNRIKAAGIDSTKY